MLISMLILISTKWTFIFTEFIYRLFETLITYFFKALWTL